MKQSSDFIGKIIQGTAGSTISGMGLIPILYVSIIESDDR
jgi:hypothetical protein